MAEKSDFPTSYRDPLYAQLDSGVEQKLGLPVGLLSAIRTEGERTNADRVSSAGARTPYQIIPATRDAILKRDGIDAYLSPQNAAEVAGILLRDSLKRNDNSPEAAVREYHGGTDRKAWGPVNNAYWQRVSAGIRDTATQALSSSFGKWLQENPAEGALPSANPPDTPAPADLAAGFGSWLQSQQPAPQIPGQDPSLQAPPAVAPISDTSQASLADKLAGAGEAALSTVTGMTGGALGMIGGTLKGMAEQILSGQFGTPQAANLVEQSAAQGAQALTYAPRTPEGQAQAQSLGEVLQNIVPVAAVAPGMAPAMAGMRSAAPARVVAQAGAEGIARDVAGPAAAAAVGKGVETGARLADMAGKQITTLPRRALEALRKDEGTPGTMGSVGAAGTDMATQRVANAQGMPVPIQLTRGQATRDPAQLKFEVETAKMPDQGAPLRQRYVEQNDQILRNFDTWVDQTGAEAPTLRAVGQSVDKALVDSAKADKAKIRTLYAAADKAGELEAPVDLRAVIDHINQAAPEATTAPLIQTARNLAIKLGIAKDEGGQLVPLSGPVKVDALMNRMPGPASVRLKAAETFRQAINRNTDLEPTNIRQATIIKGLIDEATAGAGGELYRRARMERMRYAQNYEDRATIAKILNNKRGTTDRQVAFEDIFDHSILKGSLDDVRNVRRVLQRGGSDGQQAWKELQGATVGWIRDQATKNVATDASGNRVISPSALDKAIKGLDVDGRLDFIFGKQGAQQLRDINDLAQVAKTVPPEAAVNTSNTAATILAAMADSAQFATSGIPAPVFTVGRATLGYVKDIQLRKRINAALNNIEKQQSKPVGPPAAPPPKTMH